jgi:hypothetical protein
MGRWDELDKTRAVQSGKGPGEFGPDYSERKRYQLGYGNESPSPLLKEYLDNVGVYEPHVIEPYHAGEEAISKIRDMGHHHDKDFQNKYVGYMILALVLGVLGIGIIGILYMNLT